MLGELRTELEDELGHAVDLADLRGAATTFAIEVIHTGRRVLTCDHYAADTFEMLTLSAYQRLNYQRARQELAAAGDSFAGDFTRPNWLPDSSA
ncbi:MAG: hypothetical protein EA404_12800 [Spirochaetaceae bacterium]|nr:MAG: hypothetical protein EA404_12800 [Spirochaetaceae bacterium]